jgi:ribosomal protein L37AE/L43A
MTVAVFIEKDDSAGGVSPGESLGLRAKAVSSARQPHWCPRCGSENIVPSFTVFEVWRCWSCERDFCPEA